MIKAGEIHIKDNNVLEGLLERRFSPLLRIIILEVAEKYGIVITESYRPKKHRNDLHGTQPVRAVDLRTYCYKDGVATEIEKWINRRWDYDHDRPKMKVAWIHDSGQGLHFHVQCSEKTRRRNPYND